MFLIILGIPFLQIRLYIIRIQKILKTISETKLETKNRYLVKSNNILFDNVQGLVRSSFPSTIIDIDGNQIQVPMFEYDRKKKICFFQKEKY